MASKFTELHSPRLLPCRGTSRLKCMLLVPTLHSRVEISHFRGIFKTKLMVINPAFLQNFRQNYGKVRNVSGPGSSVGIATDYGMVGPGIVFRWERDFPPSRPALVPTQPPVQWVPGLSLGVESGRGVTLTPHPFLVPRSKSRVELYLYAP